MNNQNISDLIENYLKQILDDNEKIEIRRIEMANQFNCVPSQINYVINTRFTIQKGYLVESKRGGGGYIRIIKVNLSDDNQLFVALERMIDEELSFNDALAILQKLYEEKIITKREGNLMIAGMSKQVFQDISDEENHIRSRIMRSYIERLSYEETE